MIIEKQAEEMLLPSICRQFHCTAALPSLFWQRHTKTWPCSVSDIKSPCISCQDATYGGSRDGFGNDTAKRALLKTEPLQRCLLQFCNLYIPLCLDATARCACLLHIFGRAALTQHHASLISTRLYFMAPTLNWQNYFCT